MIKSTEIKIVPISEIKPWAKNRNTHPKDQIDRLVSIIKYQGFRNPLIISNRSGVLVTGHARYEAAKVLEFKELPVIYQDFESEDQEYAHMIADNAVDKWAALDFAGINADIANLGPDFNIDMLGLRDFKIDVSDFPELATGERGELRQMAFQLTEDQVAEVERALKICKDMGGFEETGSSNSNGNALARMAEIFITEHGSSEAD